MATESPDAAPGGSHPISRRRKLVFSSLAIAIALLTPLAATELALRVLKSHVAYQPDPDLIRSLTPSVVQVVPTWEDDDNLNGRSEEIPRHPIFIRTPTNADGLRMTRDVGKKQPGEKRILLMGDSYTEAVEVPPEERFASRLDADVQARHFPGGARWTVINGGIQNGTPSQYLLQLRRWLPRFRPDVVIVDLAPNDLNDDTKFEHDYGFVLDERQLPVAPRARTKLWILQRFYLARYLEVALSRLGRGPHDLVFPPASTIEPMDWKPLLCAGDEAMERAWVDRTGRYLLGLRDMTEAAGAQFGVLMIHYEYVFDDEPWYRRRFPGLEEELERLGCTSRKGAPYREFVHAFLAEQGIRYRDPYDALLRAKIENPKRKLWMFHDYHFSPAGHRVIAAELAALVDPLLTPPAAPPPTVVRRSPREPSP